MFEALKPGGGRGAVSVRLRRVFFVCCVLAFASFLFYCYYPLKYYVSIKRYAEKYALDARLVCAVIHAESRFNANAVSRKGARGLMQLMAPTAAYTAERLGYEDFTFDMAFLPDVNIDLGCAYFRELLSGRGENVNLALASYNAGPGNVARWIEKGVIDPDLSDVNKIPFGETLRFVKKVRFSEKIYGLYARFIK